MQAADEWRGTTVQVYGLWPFAAGTGSPMVGVPIGRNLLSGATPCADPISWFQRAHLISTPSMFVLGKVGLGKSSLVRRMALGLTGYGVLPMVLGDLKPDYVDLIRALGGQVIELGRGRRDAQRNLQRLRRRCRCGGHDVVAGANRAPRTRDHDTGLRLALRGAPSLAVADNPKLGRSI